MIESAQPEGCATWVFPRLVKPCLEEGHLREDLECETSGDWVSRTFGVGRGCGGLRGKRRTRCPRPAESPPR